MTPLDVAKGVLVAAGIVVFFAGIRTANELLRWIGIGFVVAALGLRFVQRLTRRDES